MLDKRGTYMAIAVALFMFLAPLFDVATTNSFPPVMSAGVHSLPGEKEAAVEPMLIDKEDAENGGQEADEEPEAEKRYEPDTEEMDLLARAVYSEARGEPEVGQVAVAAVILNRLEDDEFPNTISGVIFQPLAFTAVADGQFWYTPNADAYKAVEEALEGSDPSEGALYYYNPVTATSRWIFSRPVIKQIGQHRFAS